jgi:hypothetical protein
MSSRWVYHHRRENGVTLENWRLYCDFWEQHTPTPVHSEKTAKHNTHHYILPRSLCIITLSLFSRDRGFSCLEIPISVVIWIGFWGRGKRKTTRYLLLAKNFFVLSPSGVQPVQLTLFYACGLRFVQSKVYTVQLEGFGWTDGLIDIYIENAGSFL